MPDLDLTKTFFVVVSSLISGGGFYALIRAALRKLGKSGWRVGIWVAREDLAKLTEAAASGRAAKERADSIVREAENRVAKAEAAAAHACEECRKMAADRDRLAVLIAKELKP